MEKPYLATLDDDGWTVADAEVSHQKSPSTFEIPPFDERSTLEVGDWVKLRFLFFVDKNGTQITGEHMWVEVIDTQDNCYQGILINQPFLLDAIKYGDTLWFESRHVIDITREGEQDEEDEEDE
jgi:uncharacterized protein YegJ (DUF2314 family)